MKILNITHLIQAIKHRLHGPSNWLKGNLYNGHGRVCLMGACIEALDNAGITGNEYDKLIKSFRLNVTKSASKVTHKPWPGVEFFNDHHTTNHQLVVQVLNHALQKLMPDRKLQIAKSAHKAMAASK